MIEVNAGSFERLFAELFSRKIEARIGLSKELVSETYNEVLVELRGNPSAADALYIDDMYSVFSKNWTDLERLNGQALIKRIFETIYQH